MKLVFMLSAVVVLAGCFGEPTLDVSSKETMKASFRDMQESLPKSEQEELGEAMAYFSIGGMEGIGQMIGEVFSGNDIDPEATARANLSKLDGRTAGEIISRYHETLAEKARAAEAREKAEAAKEQKRERKEAENELVKDTIDNVNLVLGSGEFDTARQRIRDLQNVVEFKSSRELVEELLNLVQLKEE